MHFNVTARVDLKS